MYVPQQNIGGVYVHVHGIDFVHLYIRGLITSLVSLCFCFHFLLSDGFENDSLNGTSLGTGMHAVC